MVELVNYGIDWSGPWPSARSGTNFNDTVNIPQHNIMLTESQRPELQMINSLQESSLFGIDIYINTVQLLRGYAIFTCFEYHYDKSGVILHILKIIMVITFKIKV